MSRSPAPLPSLASLLFAASLTSLTSLASLTALTGCAIPDTQFEATGGADAGELPGAALTIVPSSTSLEVDEAGEVELMVALSQAPSAPLTVAVTTPSSKISVSHPELTFTADNFAAAQRLVVTALPDADAADERAELTLASAASSPAVASVSVTVDVSDDDTVQLTTNIGAGGVVSINEGGTATVRVRLTAQPAGEVRVQALVASGPVSITGATSRLFTPADYDVEQAFTFAAADDANLVSEDVMLTLRGPGVPDLTAVLRTVDDDTQNLLVTPPTLEVTEEGAAGIVDVSLTQQPSSDVVVTITTTTGKAAVSPSQVTFTPQNYATPRHIEVTGRADNDTANASDTIRFNAAGLVERTSAITIRDNDVQQLLVDANNPHQVTEGASSTFGVTLRYQPTADVVVTVASLATGVATASPTSLRFTSADYATPHLVTVTGTQDNNLASNNTSIRLSEGALGNRDVPVTVADDDTQAFVVTPSTLLVPEGGNRTFNVSLAFDPGTTVTGAVASSNAAALAISRTTLSFSSANYATPVAVTVTAPVDVNDVDETSIITMSGCGAPANATVAATVDDGTTRLQYGWPTQFANTIQFDAGVVIAYRIQVVTTSKLDSFAVWAPAAGGDFRMALYDNNGAAPGALRAAMPLRRPLGNGATVIDISPDVDVPAGDYWLVIRMGQRNAINYSDANVTGTRCIRNTNITNLDDPWPDPFGPASCGSARLVNLWINNYSQP